MRLWMALALTVAAEAATKVAVTVIEQRSGKPVTDLQASDFRVLEDKTERRVERAEFGSTVVDVMLLLDTSLVGGMVQPVAADLIAQLREKEQMAVVGFDASAEMVQDFTGSKELLQRALAGLKYGNSPRVLDALFAAIDGGFRGTGLRRVVVLVTAGFEGPSRVSERDVLKLARQSSVSVFPVYATGVERGMFERLARQTGGACFNLRDMQRAGVKSPGPAIFQVLREFYTLQLQGNLALGERVTVEIKRPGKYLVSALPLE